MFDFLKLNSQDEKKVEYIELIYDLVFVYMIGRNSALVHNITNGFIDPFSFLTYVLCTLITIQIWTYTTMFINRYGSNDFEEYIGLFINMFLLYYMADGTRVEWGSHFYRYNTAWLLIILNIVLQYYLKYRKVNPAAIWERASIKSQMRILIIEAIIIAALIPVYTFTGYAITPIAMLFGIIASIVTGRSKALVAVDFSHLTERAMLYIVFTFGEMIIAISGYFEGDFSLNNFYFALMGFLIVVGLFMSYGFLYDHVIDREMHTDGTLYMLIHVFLIFSLNNLTTALEFMREEEVAVIPKNLFLILSFVVYYIFLFMLAPYTRSYCDSKPKFFAPFVITIVAFIVLMLIFFHNSYISIAISVALTVTIFQMLYRYRKYHICDGH